MRYFRHLPPLLRVVSIFGLLFVLASLGLLGFTYLSSPRQSFLDADRVDAIANNLTLLSVACTFMVSTYRTRLSQPDRGPLHLGSWQSQLRFIALVAALPIGSLVLAFVIPPTAGAFTIVFPISIVGLVVVFAASILVIDRR